MIGSLLYFLNTTLYKGGPMRGDSWSHNPPPLAGLGRSLIICASTIYPPLRLKAGSALDSTVVFREAIFRDTSLHRSN